MAARTHTLLAAAALALAAASPDPASVLRVEYSEDPIVLDIPDPRFYWQVSSADARGITQASYRLVVNSSTAGGATVWDTGVVQSDATTHVQYAGSPLVSDSVYTWAVQWTDSLGNVAPWSSPARFGTGFLTQLEWSSAAWIGCPLHVPGSVPNYNQLRAEFSVGAAAGVTVTQARAYITSVGYYNLRVNGDWAPSWGSRPRLEPTWSTWEVASYYLAFDLTGVLSAQAPNAIAVMLGNGWPDIDPVPGNSTTAADEDAEPRVPLLADGSVDADALVAKRLAGPLGPVGDNAGALREVRIQIVVHTSDGKTATWVSNAGGFERGDEASSSPPRLGAAGWQCGAGELQYDNVYNGCTVDKRLFTAGWDAPGYAYDNGNWTPAVLKADPGGARPTQMRAQSFPPTTLQAELPAVSVNSPAPGVYVFDLGQNIAGLVRLVLPAPVPAGVTITIRHAEVLQHPPYGPKDGNIYVGNLRSAKATDTYTTAGTAASGQDAEIFEPYFTYHGFRYVEVTGLPFPPTLETVTGLYIRAGVEHAGNVVFPSGPANVLNQLQHAVTWGIGCNLMSGIQSDCPQRDERKGWMGDSGLSLLPTHYNYKIGPMFTAWADNIRDSQMYAGDAHPAGSVADTTPHTFGSYPSDPAWGTAYPGVVYSTWRFLGDTRIAADHYPNLQAYIAFMTLRTNESGVGSIYQSYGDWCPPPAAQGGGQGPKPPKSYTSGVAFLVDLQRIIEIATALGKSDDVASYKAYRQYVLSGFNAAWLNATTGVYGSANGDGLQTANAAAIEIGAAAGAGPAVLTAAGAALANDVAVTHGSHWVTGIIGMRYLHPALTDVGQGNLAVDTLLQTDYPSYGYLFNHPDEGGLGTLFELPDGPSEGPGMNSRNHHMFASVGGWLYTDLGGIDQARPTSASYDPTDASMHGFRHPILFPRVTTHPSLAFAEAEYASLAGTYSVTWINPNSSIPASMCANQAPENAPYTFSCPAGGVFTSVVFASFGTATGACGSFAAGSCNAANTTAIISAACLGKASCTIDVADTLFGDPCYDTVKYLDAELACSTATGPAVTVSVPANGKATVRIPFPAGTDLSSVVVSEGGSPVWSGGKYVPGAAGVYAAAQGNPADTPPGQVTVDVEVGSGVYAFSAT